jgi:hypothetical protein
VGIAKTEDYFNHFTFVYISWVNQQVNLIPLKKNVFSEIYDITEILLKVALNTINQPNQTGTMYQLICV